MGGCMGVHSGHQQARVESSASREVAVVANPGVAGTAGQEDGVTAQSAEQAPLLGFVSEELIPVPEQDRSLPTGDEGPRESGGQSSEHPIVVQSDEARSVEAQALLLGSDESPEGSAGQRNDGPVKYDWDDTLKIIFDGVIAILAALCHGIAFCLLLVVGCAVLAVLTYLWFPAPSPHLQVHDNETTGQIFNQTKIDGLSTSYCGVSMGGKIDSPQLLLNGTWIYKDLGHRGMPDVLLNTSWNMATASLLEAEANNLSYSMACYNVSVLDIVDDQTRSPCTSWCDQHLGNFAFNLPCGFPGGVAPVVTACLKANVARYFSSTNRYVVYAGVAAYGATSAVVGVLRARAYKENNPS